MFAGCYALLTFFATERRDGRQVRIIWVLRLALHPVDDSIRECILRHRG